MSSKLSLSLAAALVLSAAATGAARAEPALDAAESGNPNSVDYANRQINKHSSTNAEIRADEIGNPASVNYRNRPIASVHDWKAEWDFLDSGNPASVESGNHTAPEGQAEASASATQ
jgi:hypothetical protein